MISESEGCGTTRKRHPRPDKKRRLECSAPTSLAENRANTNPKNQKTEPTFPGFHAAVFSAGVPKAGVAQNRVPSERIRSEAPVKSVQTASPCSFTASALSNTWLAKWRGFRNWKTVFVGFSSGLQGGGRSETLDGISSALERRRPAPSRTTSAWRPSAVEAPISRRSSAGSCPRLPASATRAPPQCPAGLGGCRCRPPFEPAGPPCRRDPVPGRQNELLDPHRRQRVAGRQVPYPKRGAEAVSHIGIIPRFKGVPVRDCRASYFTCENCKRALCGRHLLREPAFVTDSNGYRWAKLMRKLLRNACRKVIRSEAERLALCNRYRTIPTLGGKEMPDARSAGGGLCIKYLIHS